MSKLSMNIAEQLIESTNDMFVPGIKPMKIVKTVKTGVGARVIELLTEGRLTSKEIVTLVNFENPLRQTTYACVAWYKNDMKKKAKTVETV